MSRLDEVVATPLEGLVVVRRAPHRDDRGSLDRLYDREAYEDQGIGLSVAQVNHTVTTRRGTVRGMHLQGRAAADAKLVTCIRGRVFDVAVDLRSGSATYLEWFGLFLDDTEPVSLYLPEGFAHGFQAMEDHCELLYVHGGPYVAAEELGVRYDDPAIGIDWPLDPVGISDRDLGHPLIGSDRPGPGW